MCSFSFILIFNRKSTKYKFSEWFQNRTISISCNFDLHNDILTRSNEKLSVCCHFLNLAKAFGTVDHKILLQKLKCYAKVAVPSYYCTELLFAYRCRRYFLKYVPVPNYFDFAQLLLFSGTFLFSIHIFLFFWRVITNIFTYNR